MSKKMYAVTFFNKEDKEKIRIFENKCSARDAFYQEAMDLFLDFYGEETIKYIQTEIQKATDSIYEEIRDFCCEVEEFDSFMDFGDDIDDVEIPIIEKGNKILEKVNKCFKNRGIPLELDCDDFECGEDYEYAFNDLLLEDKDVVDIIELFEGKEKEFLEFIAKINKAINMKDDEITIQIASNEFKTIKYFEADVEI